ncbi:hypothetical protein JW868_01935 [Candidatus Woesearchaeota archaeon]|nr:hypothetical protein [Candidatus Woesearchaeota archaeon]
MGSIKKKKKVKVIEDSKEDPRSETEEDWEDDWYFDSPWDTYHSSGKK